MAWLVILTGVCGSGKSTVGRVLAEREGAEFADGDDYHSSENLRKMSSGQPLTDEDRLPWLQALHGVLQDWTREGGKRTAVGMPGERIGGVLACSALKRKYRNILTGRGELGCRDVSSRCVLVQLTASAEVIAERVRNRTHFMAPSLISSQLALLEPLGPDEGTQLTCQATSSVEEVVTSICAYISSLNPHDSM